MVQVVVMMNWHTWNTQSVNKSDQDTAEEMSSQVYS